MAMTPVEMDRMSLADLEVAADRFRKALDVLKEARSLLGNAPMTTNAAPEPQAQARPVTPGPRIELSAEEAALRGRLLVKMRSDSEPVPMSEAVAP